MVSLGNFEELVLLVLLQEEQATAVEIIKKFKNQMNKNASLPAVHVVLKRLEKKGLVKSKFGDPTPERGGRRQRLYSATRSGVETVTSINTNRQFLWGLIPN